MAEVRMPERLLKRIETTLDAIANKDDELLTQDAAAKFLGVSLKTIQNRTSDRTIPASAYVINVLGRPMYKKSKLIYNE